MERKADRRSIKNISLILTLCCLILICMSFSSPVSAKSLPAPKKVKIQTDREGPAGSGIRVFAKYGSVKGADGYQIKVTQTHDSHPDITTKTFKKNTTKTEKLLTSGYDFIEVKIKVRAYKWVDDEKVYGKWSKVKTMKFD